MAGNEAELTLVLKAKNLASRELDRMHRGLLGLSAGAKGVGHAFSLMGKALIATGVGAILAVVAGLAGATKAAADEQKGIVRLNAAIKANIKGHKEQVAGIEGVIAKREALAFSDDDLRASLTTLVTKYHDVDKAERIQAVAMDLARAKGISLNDATNLLSKGLDGSTKVLKTLGIEVDKNATKHEILAAIQKKVAGQAVAYGKSAAGAQEAFGIALQDVVEDIGGALLPVMTQAFTWLRTNAIPAIRAAMKAAGDWIDKNKPLIDTIKKIAGQIADRLRPVLESIANFVTNTVIPAISGFAKMLWGDGKGPLPKAMGAISNFMDKVLVPAFHTVIDVLQKVIGWISDLIGWIGDALDALGKLAKGVSDAFGKAGPGIGPGRAGAFGNQNGNGHAAGGWAGLHGPELSWLGEKGPEYVIPNSALRSMSSGSGYQLVPVSKRDLANAMSRDLYFRLQRAGTGA